MSCSVILLLVYEQLSINNFFQYIPMPHILMLLLFKHLFDYFLFTEKRSSSSSPSPKSKMKKKKKKGKESQDVGGKSRKLLSPLMKVLKVKKGPESVSSKKSRSRSREQVHKRSRTQSSSSSPSTSTSPTPGD